MVAFPFSKQKKARNAGAPAALAQVEPQVDTDTSGETTLKELLAPEGAIIEPNRIILGDGRYARAFVIKGWPRQAWVGFLDDLYRHNVKAAIYLDPVPNEQAQKKLNEKYVQQYAQLITEEKRGTITHIDELQRRVSDIEAIRNDIALNRNGMYMATVVILLEAESEEELEQESRSLEEQMGARGFQIRRAFLRQKEALQAVLPAMPLHLIDGFRSARNIDRGAATALFPFDQAELSHESGIFLGLNAYTRAPVFWDQFRREATNYNMNIFAPSGYGKSYFVKLIAMRSSLRGIRSVFVDPENEYSLLTDRLGGAVVNFKPGGQVLINPFDVEEEEDESSPVGKSVDLPGKIEEIKGLLQAMFRYKGQPEGLTAEELSIIELGIRTLYDQHGITTDPNSLYRPDPRPGYVGYIKKEMPTLTEFDEWIRQNAGRHAEHLHTLLSGYLKGAPMGIFDGQSRLNLSDAGLICFNLRNMEQNTQRPVAMHVALTWIWEHFVRPNRNQRKIVVADEAWMMINAPESAEFLDSMARRARKYNTGLIVASQQFTDFTRSDVGKAVLTQPETNMLLHQSDMERAAVQQIYNLSEGELNFISTCSRGEGLFRIGRHAIALSVMAIDFEKPYVNTNQQMVEQALAR